jgi:hypothetical protein
VTTGVGVPWNKEEGRVSWFREVKAGKRVKLAHHVDTRLYCGMSGRGSIGKARMDWGSWSTESTVCYVERDTSYLMDLSVLRNDEDDENRCELNTHADTEVGGVTWRL